MTEKTKPLRRRWTGPSGQVLTLREYDPEKVKAWMVKNGLRTF